LLELGVEITKLRAFRGAARGVVLRVEIEDEQPGFDRREPELLAAGGGQDEVAYRFVGHPESAPLCAPLSPESGSERNRLRFRGGSRKKFYELPQQFRWRLLRDVMAAIQGPSLDGSGPLGGAPCGARCRNPEWRRSGSPESARAEAGRTSGNRPWRTRGRPGHTSYAWERCRARRASLPRRGGREPCDARPVRRGRDRRRRTFHDPGRASPRPGPGPWRAWNSWHGREARGVFRCLRNRAGRRRPP